MAEPTVFEMEIEGVVHPIEDKEARAKTLVPVISSDNEITALAPSDGVGRGLADVGARNLIQKMGGYSTDEVDTGQVWIDGRKVYKRVINYEETTIHGASGFGFALATDIRTLVSHCLYKRDAGWPVTLEDAAIPMQGWLQTLEGYWYGESMYVMPSGIFWNFHEGNVGRLRVYGEIYYTKLSE